MNLRKIVVALVLISTAVFVVGVVLERSAAEAVPTSETTHQEGSEGSHEEGGGEETHASGAAAEEGTIFGVDPESTPFVVLAVVGSVALALGIWFRPAWGWILPITALAMSIFAVFDLREVIHQFSESHTGLGLVAIVVASLHAAAAVGAAVLSRSTLGPVGRSPAERSP